MGRINKVLAAPLLVLGGLCLSQASYGANCPTGVDLTGNTNYVQFGDALSYSLPILGLDVQSSPGQINGCIIITSGSGGVLDNNSLTTIDNAYDNEQGSQNGFFRTGDPVNNVDPGGAGQFTGDTATTWDIRIDALETFLNGGAPLIYFNHNQTNSGSTIDQDLFIWGQVILRDDAGNVLAVFNLQSVPNTIGDNFGVPSGDPGTFSTNTVVDGASVPTSDYVRARGQICLDGPAGTGNIVPCDGNQAFTFNENLGANEVANAILIPELIAFLNLPNNGGATVMQIDLRMGCNPAEANTDSSYLDPNAPQYIPPGGGGPGICPLGAVTNNGFEQAFIVSTVQPVTIPEPQSLLLVALGLVAAAWMSRRTRRA